MASNSLDLQSSTLKENDMSEKIEDVLCTSDEYHDITCSLCSKETRNVAATMYCVECVNYLCDNCIEQHNRFGAMKNHRLVDKATANQQFSDVYVDLPIQTCGKHHGKLLDMYCKNHEEVCCAACAAIDHRCTDMTYLPNVIKEFKDTACLIEDTFCHLDRSRTNITKLKVDRLKAYETYELEKTEIFEEVKWIRHKVDKCLNDVENKLKTKVNKESVIFKTAIDVDVNQLEDTISRLEDQKRDLERLREKGNLVSIFVQSKIAKRYISEAEKIQKATERKEKKNIFFLPNRELNRILEIANLGYIMSDIPACTAELSKVISIKTPEEKLLPTFSGMCSLEDGSLFICDWQNKSLKRLDDDYNVKEHLELPGKPYDICGIDMSTIAITLPKAKQMHLVSTKSQMFLARSFKTRDACCGIAYSNGFIYVACGGWRVYKEGQGHVAIFDTAGVLQSIRYNQHLSQLGHISISGPLLYIADNNNGLIIMDVEGHVHRIFTHKEMHNTLAVCAGAGNQLFVGGWSSHNVMLLNNEGQLLRVLLNQKNGVRDLHTLYYDKIRSRLIYTTRDSYKIKLFHLTYEV